MLCIDRPGGRDEIEARVVIFACAGAAASPCFKGCGAFEGSVGTLLDAFFAQAGCDVFTQAGCDVLGTAPALRFATEPSMPQCLNPMTFFQCSPLLHRRAALRARRLRVQPCAAAARGGGRRRSADYNGKCAPRGKVRSFPPPPSHALCNAQNNDAPAKWLDEGR